MPGSPLCQPRLTTLHHICMGWMPPSKSWLNMLSCALRPVGSTRPTAPLRLSTPEGRVLCTHWLQPAHTEHAGGKLCKESAACTPATPTAAPRGVRVGSRARLAVAQRVAGAVLEHVRRPRRHTLQHGVQAAGRAQLGAQPQHHRALRRRGALLAGAARRARGSQGRCCSTGLRAWFAQTLHCVNARMLARLRPACVHILSHTVFVSEHMT